MRRLGMTPVLPAFAGHIPEALVSLYPNITYSHTKWGHFGPTYLLDATDPLFSKIGETFIHEYINEFGETDHVYNCDTFNEMNPEITVLSKCEHHICSCVSIPRRYHL